ncbi:MAG TPA: D-2-hydroxyacid dehydrogenase [Moheibacter sp.]|nr:D-2-hydroxyacid dehydrogenase [Moheibacter sp.]
MKILANDGLSAIGKATLERNGFEVLTTYVAQDQLANFINNNDISILLVRSATQVTQEIIDATSLKLIGRGGVGLDNIAVDYAQSKGIPVINTPNASTVSVAEMVMAHVFSIYRNLHKSNRSMPLEGDLKFNLLKKSYSKAYELKGKTMGIIGFGNIGQEVAKSALGAGMKVIAYNRTPKKVQLTFDFFDGQTVEFPIETTSLETVLKESDVISLHVAAQDHPLVGWEEIEKMKQGAVLINTARGGVVDEEAVLRGIEEGNLLGAALDVFEQEPHPSVHLLMNDEISFSPHLAGSTEEAQDRIGLELAEQISKLYPNK